MDTIATDEKPEAAPTPGFEIPGRLKRLRNLPQFKHLTDNEFLARMETKVRSEVDASKLDPELVKDLANNLPVVLRSAYKKDVQRLLDSVKDDADSEIMRPLIEEYVFIQYLVRKQMALEYGSVNAMVDKDAKAIDVLMNRRQQLAEQLGVTPKGRRLAGKRGDDSFLKAMADSIGAARRILKSSPDLVKEETEMFGEGDRLPPEGERGDMPEDGDAERPPLPGETDE